MDKITLETKKETIIEFAKRFAMGEQNIYIDENSIIEVPVSYFWQQREVYNHIAPIIEHCDKENKVWDNFVKSTCGRPVVDTQRDEQIYGPYGLVMQLVPYQREYNALRNRNADIVNQIAFGVACVEDGSVDVDNLVDEGISPGKILVYRQGATKPQFKVNPEADILRVIDEMADNVLRKMYEIYDRWAEARK